MIRFTFKHFLKVPRQDNKEIHISFQSVSNQLMHPSLTIFYAILIRLDTIYQRAHELFILFYTRTG